MGKDTENQAQHPASDTSTNEGSKKPVFTVPLAQRIGMFAGPRTAAVFGMTSNKDVYEGATLSLIILMNQLIDSKIPFFIKGLALPNTPIEVNTAYSQGLSKVESAKPRLFLLLKVLWHPAHGIPGEKPKVYDATTIINRYNACISHYVREINQLLEQQPTRDLTSLLISTLMKIHQLKQIMSFIEAINNPDYKAWAQLELVKALALAGKFDEARSSIEAINRPSSKAQAQYELVKALGLAGKFDEARGVIEVIKEPVYKVDAQTELVKTSALAGKVDEARGVSEAIAPVDKAGAQIGFIKEQGLAGQVDEVRGVSAGINDAYYKARAQVELVKPLALAGYVVEARKVIEEINDPDFKAQAQHELVKALALAGKIDEARGVIEAMNDFFYKVLAQIVLVKASALAGQVDEAISVTKEINAVNAPYYKAIAMLTLLDLIFAESTFVQRHILPTTLNEEVGAAAAAASSPKR